MARRDPISLYLHETSHPHFLTHPCRCRLRTSESNGESNTWKLPTKELKHCRQFWAKKSFSVPKEPFGGKRALRRRKGPLKAKEPFDGNRAPCRRPTRACRPLWRQRRRSPSRGSRRISRKQCWNVYFLFSGVFFNSNIIIRNGRARLVFTIR